MNTIKSLAYLLALASGALEQAKTQIERYSFKNLQQVAKKAQQVAEDICLLEQGFKIYYWIGGRRIQCTNLCYCINYQCQQTTNFIFYLNSSSYNL